MTRGGTCIVTGGAGFIGCAISAALCAMFNRVIAVDNLHSQVHPSHERPSRLASPVELRIADVCDADAWDALFADVSEVDTIIHMAAETGTGQSLSEASRHAFTNVVGTTRMLDACLRNRIMPRQILLTSSRAVYGEGEWRKSDGKSFYPGQRTQTQLMNGNWDFANAEFIPSRADYTMPAPISIYGSTKLAQEHIMSSWGNAFGVVLKILRLQNVYGVGQSLSNPYTGIISLFSRIAHSGGSIPLYEDGNMLRDFVYIDDVACALLLALSSDLAEGKIYDVGTGMQTTLSTVAGIIASRYNAPPPHICCKHRWGDVRHAACDMRPMKVQLNFTAKISVQEGIGRFCKWVDYAIGNSAGDYGAFENIPV